VNRYSENSLLAVRRSPLRLDVLFSPWRYDYIKSGSASEKTDSCVFCDLLTDKTRRDAEKFILRRARFNFVVLNIFPYTSGHLLIVPYCHQADLDGLDKETSDEMMDLAKRSQTALREAYQPDGLNLGINLGKAAGAGVAAHVHLHVLPRWFGDVNFMTAAGQTRVIPENLSQTYEKLFFKFS
jgi:ATP adenylyltransferase